LLLESGTPLALPRHGGRWVVGAFLGEGSEGEVYQLESDDATLAVKWYFPERAQPAKRRTLDRLVQMPAPSPRFLWPIEVLGGTDSFGYVMPVRPAPYRPLATMLQDPGAVTFSTVIKLCIGLADSFLKVHALGLCYRDISYGNVFFDPATGDPLICDNDNIGIEGRDPALVLGTSRFMAPEIVRGEAMPSTATDLYSLSVLIFYLLMLHHPLQGSRELTFECFDAEAEKALFAMDPVFVFDPSDPSNRPDPTVHAAVLAYWPLFPAYVQADFTTAFTSGLTDPARRVREGVWRAHLARLLDGIVICRCGAENLTDDGLPFRPCWSCGQQVERPVRLRFGDRVFVLNAGSKLSRHQLRWDFRYDDVVGEVVVHPQRPELWGLRNLGTTSWHASDETGDAQEVPSGRAVGLVPGTTIAFGPATGLIEA
jgi:DNA-binding helix-hairpin-helix protein with protein kinase domain